MGGIRRPRVKLKACIWRDYALHKGNAKNRQDFESPAPFLLFALGGLFQLRRLEERHFPHQVAVFNPSIDHFPQFLGQAANFAVTSLHSLSSFITASLRGEVGQWLSNL